MTFLTGSQVFFKEYEDYQPKDIDKIEIIEDDNTDWSFRQFTLKGKCVFQIKKRNSVNEYIKDAYKAGCGMVVARFLSPEFINYINMEVKELLLLSSFINALDEKHLYLKTIWESYIENNAFTLTDEQRLKAYNEYKKGV